MMYGPGPIGFVAGLVTHGVVLSALQREQKNRIQTQADRVLEPYQEVLSQFTNSQLMQGGLSRLPRGERMSWATPDDVIGDGWRLDSAPMFWMTADERALVLDNAFSAFAPGQSAPLFERSVRVVSTPLPLPTATAVAQASDGAASAPGDDARADVATVTSRSIWLAEQGRRLLETSAAMFAESLDVVLDEISAQGGDRTVPQQQTHRYVEGASERMERGEFVADRCGRTLIRTLRGVLMSIPASTAKLPCSPRIVAQ